MEQNYQHVKHYDSVNGIGYCHICIWYNSIQEVVGNECLINCAQKECNQGKDPLNLLITGLVHGRKGAYY